MTTVKASSKGEFLLPKEVLDAHGIPEGAEVEVSGGQKQIVLRLVEKAGEADPKSEQKLSVKEFLARRIRYDGPDITDDMIDEAILEEAKRRWNEKNSR